MSIATRTRAAHAAGEGRSVFVDYAINDFVARTRMAVSDEVRSFILDEVLYPDDAWVRGLKERSFDPDTVAQILTEALNEAANANKEGHELGLSTVGTSAQGPFYTVIHDRWHCPFPFIFC